MADILLTTLNARYSHASLGLRYLLANMGPLESRTRLLEFTIKQRPIDIAEQLLAQEPRIIGLGVYIWNVRESEELVATLKQVRPEIIVVLGGPEVSYEQEVQRIVALADYLIPGQADLAFARLCERLLAGERPAEKVVEPEPFAPERLQLPYRHYSDHDIHHRVVYVEASRGCPFKCEFCLSALDRSATPFDLDAFLGEMEALHRRGLRRFKFVDRTFNLKVEQSIRIMEFFLDRLDEALFLHFELVPDRLPEALKETIRRFPPGSLQFEIGVQSFNPKVQALISRRQDNARTESNLRWLREQSHAHLHADLIIGLPGEDMASFAAGFDRLAAMNPHEIQVGILKRLRGAPIARHSEAHAMRYQPNPPYNVLATDRIDFADMQRLARFARYWDLVANAGRFRATLPLLLGEAPFARFLALSDWLYAQTGQTHRIQLPRLFTLLHQALTGPLEVDPVQAEEALLADYALSGQKGVPDFAAGPAGSRSRRAFRQQRHMTSDK
ncbi:MAG TPA: DUF4080 domain-containing protein [Gammaproteobacteria bacterium]